MNGSSPVLGWRDRLRLSHTAGALQPVHQLRLLASDTDGSRAQHFEALGADAYFRLRHPIPAGWYMAEVTLRFSQGITHARFYADFGAGETEENSYGMPLRSNHMTKRLLYLHADCRLRFDPMPHDGTFALMHFRLVRLPARMAASRLARKLKAHGHRGQTNDRGNVCPPNAQDFSPEAWRTYNAIFDTAADSKANYERWIREVEPHITPDHASQRRSIDSWRSRPVISIVLPTWNTPGSLLRECIDSVLAQSYPHWQLCIADDASDSAETRAILNAYAVRDTRIQVVQRPRNGHICRASNSALALAQGDLVTFLDHDDTLAPHALFALAETLQSNPQAQILFSDEDKLDADGHRCEPFFKPGWSPDLLLSQNYICHLTAIRRPLVEAAGGFRPGFEGSQDYDLLLRCIRLMEAPSRQIVHIPQVLYHWRKAPGSTARGHDQKDYASVAALRALQEHVDSTGQGVRMAHVEPGIYRAQWPVPTPAPLVSLIIPTRDHFEVLRQCVESILSKTTYPHYEVIVVDNQSTCPETLAYLRALDTSPGSRVRVLRHDEPFNYSAINNRAAKHANGALLGLINNDVEVINGDWLTEMASHAIRPEIGCVGAKLYYPEGSLQHAGVVLGIGGVAGHSHKHQPGYAKGYFGRLRTVHNVSAVTGAALLVRKAVFERVGGLDAHALRIAFNDVDFCLRVRQAGYLNLWTPFAEFFHHESKTRGMEDTEEKRKRFAQECDTMRARWGHLLQADPFYGAHLTLLDESYGISPVPRLNARSGIEPALPLAA